MPAHREDRLWYFPTLQEYWMESGNACADYEVVRAHPDAVFLTQPSKLTQQALSMLRCDAHTRLMAAQKEERDE